MQKTWIFSFERLSEQTYDEMYGLLDENREGVEITYEFEPDIDETLGYEVINISVHVPTLGGKLLLADLLNKDKGMAAAYASVINEVEAWRTSPAGERAIHEALIEEVREYVREENLHAKLIAAGLV